MNHKSVLVVDDDEAIRDGLGALLGDEGYDVYCAENGRVALEWLGSNPVPARILLDLMMPVRDGEPFCEEQKRVDALASVPVIIMTAGVISEEIKALKVAETLRKSVDVDLLLDTLQRWVRGRSLDGERIASKESAS